jgi:hypothetical protein
MNSYYLLPAHAFGWASPKSDDADFKFAYIISLVVFEGGAEVGGGRKVENHGV